MNTEETAKGGESEHDQCEGHSVNDAPQQHKIDATKECEACGARWKDKTGGKLTVCPSCGRENTLRVIATEFTDDATSWVSGVHSLDEVVRILECKALLFGQFRDEGWELDRPIAETGVRLRKQADSAGKE